MPDQIWELPWQIHVALGSGYAAYLIAYAGVRQHHSSTDTIFRTIVFGLVAAGFINWISDDWWGLILAGLATIAAGIIWRWKGSEFAGWALRSSAVSWSDDVSTAWISITATRTDLRPSQLSIDIDDGRTLCCDDTRNFRDAPYGPCIFGLDGSVALYVTAERRADGTWIEHENIRDPEDGDRITFVPVSAIKRVEIRHWSKSKSKAITPVAY